MLSSKRLKLSESPHAAFAVLPARPEVQDSSAGRLGGGNVAGGTIEGAEAQCYADALLPEAGSKEWNECDEEEAAEDEEAEKLRYGMSLILAHVCLLIS